MLTHVKKNSLFIVALSLTGSLVFAQGAPPNASAPGPKSLTPSAQQAPPAATPAPGGSNSASGVDGSTATALDYLFNHRAGEGTTMKAGNEVASALADKIKAVDVLKTPGLDDPIMRARFETYLCLKEVPQARIAEYFGKMQQVSDMLKANDTFGAW